MLVSRPFLRMYFCHLPYFFRRENTPESLINLLVALIGVAYSSLTVLGINGMNGMQFCFLFSYM